VPDPKIFGFTPSSVAKERELENRFAASLDKEEIRAFMKRLSARPHNIGSPYQKENAEYLVGLFKSWGFDAKIEEFQVLFPTPKFRLLEMVAPTTFTAKLSEPEIPEDHTSNTVGEALPPYNAYSPDGDVTGELVYVNYGVPADYEELAKRGIDVKGKIVISRYGGSWRGIKPKVAAEHGAIGCLIYSDPKDDGYGAGDVYPKGGFRNENGVQRGSIADMPIYPGDPLTPGVGAVPGAKRLKISQAVTIVKIPTLPISYGDALPLLKAMEGPVAPGAWRGGLPITYHLGGGPAKVHLKLAFNWDLVPARDVVATLPGTDRANEWIIRGNHYDGWVTGAEDPISGQSCLVEEAKQLGALVKSGWRPRRTIIYCAWDGEEPGLLGSTEWVETHADELARHAAVYINTDDSGRGFFGAEGSPQLETLVTEAVRDVKDPETDRTVLGRYWARSVNGGATGEPKVTLGAMGSGSDFSGFLQHEGIAALNFGFGGEGGGGSYHSLYDSFDYYTRFIDPEFRYERTLAEVTGRTVLRLADCDVLPFKAAPAATAAKTFVNEVVALADQLRKDTRVRNDQLADGTLAALDDPSLHLKLPEKLDRVPSFDFKPLVVAAERLEKAAKRVDPAFQKGYRFSPDKQAQLDQLLFETERALLGDGLPGRPWYRHAVYAPGLYTGYGVKTLPAVREALEQRQWRVVQAQIPNVAKSLNHQAEKFEEIARLLKS
jgi:N-acetylated-alpha-linked acidic dipeptidase